MKLCECGCGCDAPIAKATNTISGAIKGQPQRFVKGHQRRGAHHSLASRIKMLGHIGNRCKWGHEMTPENSYVTKAGTSQCIICRLAYRKAATVRGSEWFNDYKKTLRCARCPETHPSCLDFHHRNPKTKLFKVGGAAPSGMPREKVMAEIAKCVVLCANCHRKEHDDERQRSRILGEHHV
jgi:hypothetical protein